MLLVGAFGPPMRRSRLGGQVAGIVAGAVAGFGASGSVPPIVVVAVAALVAAVLGVVVGIALIPTTTRRAFEAISWIGHRDLARVRSAIGVVPPLTPAGMAEFLVAHPIGTVPGWIRAELLISLGRVAEARAELDAQPIPDAEIDRLEVVALRAFADLVESGTVDQQAFDAELLAWAEGSPLEREAAVIAAMLRARLRLATGAPEPLEPLARVRGRLGREATTTVLRDTWLPFARSMALNGAVAGSVLIIIDVAR
jgi:hypothetical protein